MIESSLNLLLQAEAEGTGIGSFFSKQFYGNTVGGWALALGIVFGSLIVGKILYWTFKNVVAKWTAKTENKLDDLILDMIEEPIVFSLVIIGIYAGVSMLNLPESVHGWGIKAVYLMIAINIAWLLTRGFDAMFEMFLKPMAEKSESDLDDQLLPIIRKGTRSVIWILCIIVGLNNAGYDVGAVLAGLGIGGLALAMAAQDTVSNVFGGFTIFSDRPFKLNDRIKIDGYDGKVEEIGIRSTRIRTLEGRLVTIPNSSFTDNPVENVSLEPKRKVTLNLGLTYDMTPDKIEEAIGIVREIAKEVKGVEDAIKVSFNAFGDFALNLLVIYYIEPGKNIMDCQTKMNLLILRRFADAGIEMAFPTQTLYTKAL
jgi:MscS family membrane protein